MIHQLSKKKKRTTSRGIPKLLKIIFLQICVLSIVGWMVRILEIRPFLDVLEFFPGGFCTIHSSSQIWSNGKRTEL